MLYIYTYIYIDEVEGAMREGKVDNLHREIIWNFNVSVRVLACVQSKFCVTDFKHKTSSFVIWERVSFYCARERARRPWVNNEEHDGNMKSEGNERICAIENEKKNCKSKADDIDKGFIVTLSVQLFSHISTSLNKLTVCEHCLLCVCACERARRVPVTL